MKSIMFASAMVVALAAGYGVRTLSVRTPHVAAAEARSAAEEADGPEWEFCAVARAQFLPGPRGNQYWIIYFRGEGVQTLTVETGVSGNAQGKAIARLGSEGWELVGEGALDTGRPTAGRDDTGGRALFFKRLKK